MEVNLTEVDLGWISECGSLLIMVVEEKNLMDALAISTGDCMHKKSNLIKFVLAGDSDREWKIR